VTYLDLLPKAQPIHGFVRRYSFGELDNEMDALEMIQKTAQKSLNSVDRVCAYVDFREQVFEMLKEHPTVQQMAHDKIY